MRAPPSLRCLLAPLALLAFGCGAPELTTLGRSCGGDPLSCGPTETCWPGGDGILSCHGAKEYVAAGSDCELLAGRTTCGPGMICLTGERPAYCTPYCDPARPDRGCPAPQMCVQVTPSGSDGGVSVHACVPCPCDGGLTGPGDLARSADLTAPRDLAKPADGGGNDLAIPDGGQPDQALSDGGQKDAAADSAVPDLSIDLAAPPDLANTDLSLGADRMATD